MGIESDAMAVSLNDFDGDSMQLLHAQSAHSSESDRIQKTLKLQGLGIKKKNMFSLCISLDFQ